MFLLRSRVPLQDGLSPVLGSSEKSESLKTQVGTSCGAKHQDIDLQNKEAASGELSTKTCKGRDTSPRCSGDLDKK